MAEYKVHNILDMRIEQEEEGFVCYYLIDWGDGISDPTWEPASNLSCPLKLKQFRSRQEKANNKIKMSSMSPVQQKNYKLMLKEEDSTDKEIRQKFEELRQSSPYPIAFDRKLNVRRIISAFEHKGKPIYVVAWKGSNKVDAIPAKICNVMIPEHVMDFLETKLWIRDEKGMLIKWGVDMDEDYESPWGKKLPKISGEINNVDYSDYDKESLSQSESEVV